MSYKSLGLSPIESPFSSRKTDYGPPRIRIYQPKSDPIEGAAESDRGKLFIRTKNEGAIKFVSSFSGMVIAETLGLQIEIPRPSQNGKKAVPKIYEVSIDKDDFYKKDTELVKIYENKGAEKTGTKFRERNGIREEVDTHNFKRCKLLVIKLDEPYDGLEITGVAVVNYNALNNLENQVVKKRKDLMESIGLGESDFTYALENIIIKATRVDNYYAFDFETKPYTEKLAKENNVYLQQPEIVKLRDEGVIGVPQLKGTTDFESLAQTESTIGQEDQTVNNADDVDEIFNS